MKSVSLLSLSGEEKPRMWASAEVKRLEGESRYVHRGKVEF